MNRRIYIYVLMICFCLQLGVVQKISAQTNNEFSEQYRPQFHFTPEQNWMNDPNGLVFHDGQYHLFFQYNPYGDQWGNMSWGHAVSHDLLHWEHRGVAIPVENGMQAWSGSAVVDHNNTSGFGSIGNPPIVAIYTGHVHGQPQVQNLAYSTDNGENWTIYEGNPVLDIGNYDFRDPKVFWHEDSGRWVMAVARAVDRVIDFYGSNDLKDWELLSSFGPAGSIDGVWECPELFELPVDGDPNNTKWVLQVDVTSAAPAGGSGAQYFIGDFDGETFTSGQAEVVPEGDVFDDFERNHHGDWEVTGESFGSGPVRGTLPDQQPVIGFIGERLINSYHNGDGTVGKMVSPAFAIENHYINFLIGGGNHPGEVGMDLIVDGEVIHSSTGRNSENLDWRAWNVSEYLGEQAHFEIYDFHTGGWGHILIDHIMFSDEPAAERIDFANWVDYGPDFYATQSWSDIQEDDGRRIWIAWMSNWMYAGAIPTSPWRGAMSIPREVGLTLRNGEVVLKQKPIKELETLRDEHTTVVDRPVTGSFSISELGEWKSNTVEIKADIDVGDAREIGIRFDYGDGNIVRAAYNRFRNEMIFDRTRSGNTGFHGDFGSTHTVPFNLEGDNLTLHLLLDQSSLELFADDGTVVFTGQIFPPDTDPEILFYATNGTAHIERLDVWNLSSVWDELKVSTAENYETPRDIELKQNYPNPFNPTTVIQFHLPQMSEVQLEIFNVSGQRVAIIHSGNLPAGRHEMNWNVNDGHASGLYFYRLTAGDQQKTKKMMLIK